MAVAIYFVLHAHLAVVYMDVLNMFDELHCCLNDYKSATCNTQQNPEK